MTTGGVRIGELARRTGVSPELLRAWEQRYALLTPERSPGGFRLYSAADEARIRRMTQLLAEGLSAAEAAAAAVRATSDDAPRAQLPAVDALADELRRGLDEFRTAAAHDAFDRLLVTVSVETIITSVVVPYLHDLGMRWGAGTASVAQEHFASNLLRGRLLALARDWGSGSEPSALLACLPGEEHDLGLIMFGLLIARRGWRVTFLGANTPFDTLTAATMELRPTTVVLATVSRPLLRRHRDGIRALAETVSVHVSAPVDEQTLRAAGARPLPGDLAAAAGALTP